MSAQQYGHDGQHHGRGTPDCPVELHHHHDERCVSPLDERQQRAREAFDDAMGQFSLDKGWAERVMEAREDAIGTATRVKLTPEIIRAGREAWSDNGAGSWTEDPGPRELARARAILEAAGFEVEQ